MPFVLLVVPSLWLFPQPNSRTFSVRGHRHAFDSATCVAGKAAFGAREYWIVGGPGPSAESRGLVIAKGLLDFVTGVHDEWAVLGDRLADGTALKQQQFGFVRTILKVTVAGSSSTAQCLLMGWSSMRIELPLKK